MAKTLKSNSDDQEQSDAPPGWKKIYSARKKRFYFYNESTRMSVWKVPTEENVPAKKRKHKKKTRKKHRNEDSSDVNSPRLDGEQDSETGLPKPGTPQGRLLPKVKKGSDLIRAVQVDPAFKVTGARLDASSKQKQHGSDSETGSCKYHKDGSIPCSKQKGLSNFVSAKKKTKKRMAEEDWQEETEEQSSEEIISPAKRLKASVNISANTAVKTPSTSDNKATHPLTSPLSVTENSQKSEQNQTPAGTQTSGRKMVKGQRKLTEARKSEGGQVGTNFNNNINSKEKVVTSWQLKNMPGGRCQSNPAMATRSSSQSALLPSYEEKSSEVDEKSFSPENSKCTSSFNIPLSPKTLLHWTPNTPATRKGFTKGSTPKSAPPKLKHGGTQNVASTSWSASINLSDSGPGTKKGFNKNQTQSTAASTNKINRTSESYVRNILDMPVNSKNSQNSSVNEEHSTRQMQNKVSNSRSNLNRNSYSGPYTRKGTTTRDSTSSTSNSIHPYSGCDTVNTPLNKSTSSLQTNKDFSASQGESYSTVSSGLNTDFSGIGAGRNQARTNNFKCQNSRSPTGFADDIQVSAASPLFFTGTEEFERQNSRCPLGFADNRQISSTSSVGFTGTGNFKRQKSRSPLGFVDSSQIPSLLSGGLFPVAKAPTASVYVVEEEMEVEASENSEDKPEKEVTELYVVVDTNVLIDEIDFILELKDSTIGDLGKPYIVIPWVVLGELDQVKMGKSPNYVISTNSRNKARTAVNVLNTLIEGKHPSFVGQTSSQNSEKFSGFEVTSNDDKILKCCLQFQKIHGEGSTLLLSNDTNLRSKAVISGVESSSKLNFYNCARKKFKTTKPSDTSSKGSVETRTNNNNSAMPAISGVNARTNNNNSGPCAVSSISLVNSANNSGPCRSVPAILSVNNANLTKPNACSSEVVSTAARTFSDTNRPATSTTTSASAVVVNKEKEKETYTVKDLVQDVCADVKDLLKDSLSVILKQEMQEVYGDLWEEIVLCKPPWTLADVLSNFNKHWMAVFGMSVKRQTQEDVRHLRNLIKGYCVTNLEKCVVLVHTSLSVFKSFSGQQAYRVMIASGLKKLDHLLKIVRLVLKGKLEVQKLDILLQEKENPIENGDIVMQPVSVTTASSSTTTTTASVTIATNVDDHDSSVKQCFQLVWDNINYFSGEISDRLSKKPENEERAEVLNFLCKLCANLASLHTVYAKITQDTDRAAMCGLFGKLLQVLNRFAADLNCQNLALPLLDHIKLFFTKVSNRQTIASGLSQLEQMMQRIVGIRTLLTTEEVVAIETYSQQQSLDMGVT